MDASSSPGFPPSIQLLANAPGKAVGDGPRAWGPALTLAMWMEVWALGFGMAEPQTS